MAKTTDQKTTDQKATDHKTPDHKTPDVTTYVLRQALAARVGDHVEIAVEAEDGSTFKIRATSDQLDALTGDLETILEADDAAA